MQQNILFSSIHATALCVPIQLIILIALRSNYHCSHWFTRLAVSNLLLRQKHKLNAQISMEMIQTF